VARRQTGESVAPASASFCFSPSAHARVNLCGAPLAQRRQSVKMQNMFYLPHLSKARIVKAYRFESPRFGPHCGVLLTDCESTSPVRYAHVLVVNQGVEIFGAQCFAVASKINKNAPSDSPRSHFLGVFPGFFGGARHENLDAAHAWAELSTSPTPCLCARRATP